MPVSSGPENFHEPRNNNYMREKYEAMSLVALKELAKARGIRHLSTMKKKDVIDSLLAEEENGSGGQETKVSAAQTAPAQETEPAQRRTPHRRLHRRSAELRHRKQDPYSAEPVHRKHHRQAAEFLHRKHRRQAAEFPHRKYRRQPAELPHRRRDLHDVRL